MELFAYELSRSLAAKVDLRLVKWSGSGRLRAVLFALPYLLVRAKWELLRGGIDVIHVHDGVLAPIAYMLSRLFRKPYTVQIHGLDTTYKNPLFRAVVPAAVRRANIVFCISQATAEHLKQAGVEPGKIIVVPLAASDVLYGKADKKDLLTRLELTSETPILLTVGRLIKRKGVAWFIDSVFPELIKRHPNLIYLVIGEGEDRPSIEAAIKQHRLEKNVRLLGRVDDDLRLAAYNGADVFVMPNINVPGDMEGFGLVLLEAALCARPVVAADTEGIKDAIQSGKNGVLVPVKDAAAFQAEISRFLDGKDYAENFGKIARQFTLENYQWDRLADRYIELYKKLQTP
jgi:glycosyltransferase involved in cell wall biosynthesis